MNQWLQDLLTIQKHYKPTLLAHVYFTPSSAASGHKDLNDRTFRIDDGDFCHTKKLLI